MPFTRILSFFVGIKYGRPKRKLFAVTRDGRTVELDTVTYGRKAALAEARRLRQEERITDAEAVELRPSKRTMLALGLPDTVKGKYESGQGPERAA